MKSSNKTKQKTPPWENPIFLTIMTFVGGYMNGYTYITRNNILANMHTANMSKLGINIALGNWQEALRYFIPIVACILGAVFSELVKSMIIKCKYIGDWRKIALVIGKSNHVGKPLCTMLMNRGATLINANSKTKDLSSLVKMADIIISCVGRQNLIKSEDIKEDAVVIGVGFTYVNGKQILDFDVDEIVALGKAKFVSNRINCTGKATINSLIDNVIELYKMNFDIK
jgi:5,10-methylene-tetrahydrofolate dehydrogenase/methenyl tetrahydrofolate cyclohydrolase